MVPIKYIALKHGIDNVKTALFQVLRPYKDLPDYKGIILPDSYKDIYVLITEKIPHILGPFEEVNKPIERPRDRWAISKWIAYTKGISFGVDYFLRKGGYLR